MIDKLNISQGTKPPIMPLNELTAGQEGVIKQIMGGIGFVKRLLNIGIRIGSRIKIINASGGPIIISAEGTKAAIGRGAASRILVEVYSDKIDDPELDPYS